MIIEAFSYLLSPILNPVPKWARKMGYLYESIGIESRYLRCQKDWQPHLDKSKEAILEAAENCKLKRSILIAGSGPGYDLPLEELLDQFSRIILLDAVHPKPIRRLAKKLEKKHGKNRIMLLAGDVTELADSLVNQPEQIPTVHTPSLYHGFPDIDLVVSLNIASQLAISPSIWLRRHGVEDEDALDQFGKELVQAHIKWLSGFDCQTLLICDRQWTRKEMLQGRVIERDDPLFGIPMPRPEKIWTWRICPVEEMPNKADRQAGICRENIVGAHLL